MTKTTYAQLAAGILFSLCLVAWPAAAAVDHTYVSGKGTDTGGCDHPPNACRTFAYAIGKTTAAGVIIVMDAADYGPVTVTKSISIVADADGPAGVNLAAGNAITINAGSGDVVNLRGLTLDGEGTAVYGIALNSAGALTISNCYVRHFQNTGILITPEISAGTNYFVILNTVSNDNGIGLSFGGIATHTNLTVRNLVANNNGTGIYVYGGTVTFAGSMATGNSQYGIYNHVRNADPNLTHIFSYGDNEINGNGTNVTAPITLLAKE